VPAFVVGATGISISGSPGSIAFSLNPKELIEE
jgi:hypothetical protein